MAHITGGGITENLPRVLPEGCGAEVDPNTWQRPAIFDWLADKGPVTPEEMLRTFNCGIGFVFALPADSLDDALQRLRDAGEAPCVIGKVVEGEAGVRYSA